MYRKSKIKSSFLAFAFFASPKLLAMEWDFCPYVGADMQIRNMSFQKGFGDDLFKKESKQGNFYVGCKLNEYFGLEVGYQVSEKKDKDILTSAAPSLGQVRPDIGWSETGTRQIKGWNFNVIGFLPIHRECQVSLIGLAGLSNLEVRLKDTWTAPNGPGLPIQYEQIKFKQKKSLLRLGGGLQKVFSNRLGIRTTVIWENTARFNNISQSYLNERYTAKLKNSWIYGVGLFILF